MPKTVTCLLINNENKILLLKRSNKVRTYKGQWGGVAGYIEEYEKPIETAYKEIKEEISINKKDLELIKSLKPIKLTDNYNGEKYDWEIYFFVFKTKKRIEINIDWEHTEYRWIKPSEINKYNTVPQLKRVVLEIIK